MTGSHEGSAHGSAHGGAVVRPTFGLRRVFEAPALHQDWAEGGKSKVQEERKVTWSELFFDLFYVVACINLSHNLEAHLSFSGFGRFFLYYSFFWKTWVSLVVFQTRIKLTGLVFDYMTMIYMLGVLGMILHSTDTSHYKQFAISYAVCRITLAAKSFISGATIPRAITSGYGMGVIFTFLAILGVISAFFSWSTFVVMAIIILVLEVFLPLLPVFVPKARLPVHVDHMSERYGLLMMIFLGETIVGLGSQKLAFSVEQYAAIILSTIICYNLHLLYYHGHPDQHLHALRIHRNRGFTWTYSHWFLGCAFLLCGTAIRIINASYINPYESSGHRRSLLASAEPKADAKAEATDGYTGAAKATKQHSFHAGEISDDVAWLLCISYAASLHILALIRAAHYWNNRIFDKARDEQGVSKTLTDAWWALVCVWPFAVYFIPFAKDSFGGIGLLAYLAAHGILFNIAETLITHNMIKHGLDSVRLGPEEAEHQKRYTCPEACGGEAAEKQADGARIAVGGTEALKDLAAQGGAGEAGVRVGWA